MRDGAEPRMSALRGLSPMQRLIDGAEAAALVAAHGRTAVLHAQRARLFDLRTVTDACRKALA